MLDKSVSLKKFWTGAGKELDRQEKIALRNWVIVWILIANAGFSLMYFVGSPPRIAEIITFGVVGLLVRGLPFIWQSLSFILAMVYAILSFIAGLFNLAISSLLASLSFFSELDYTQSIEYIIGGCVILGLVGAAFKMLRCNTKFIDIRLVLLAVAATISMAQVDHFFSKGMRGHYKRTADADTPFTSAVEQSGIASELGLGKRNIVIVVVESLGLPVDNPEMTRLLFAEYDNDVVRSRFDISRGTTPYYNSTTAGEIRELCGRWGDYYNLIEAEDSSCLPARLASKGFDTWAYHSFAGDFFERSSWYPNIGFQHRLFREEIVRNGSRSCGGVFPGACDRDVPSQLATLLKGADGPQFVYWLTVNSHLPVPPSHNLDVGNCEKVSISLAAEFPMICRQFAIWAAIDAAIVREIAAPNFPPTDILIVGDHMPPYFDRHHRRQFAPDLVPWLLLRWREDSSPINS